MPGEPNSLPHGKEYRTTLVRVDWSSFLPLPGILKPTTQTQNIPGVPPRTLPPSASPTKLLGFIPDVPETNFLVEVPTHHALLCADDVIAAGACKHGLYACRETQQQSSSRGPSVAMRTAALPSRPS